MYSSDYVWAKVLGFLEKHLGTVTISAYFDDIEVIELTEEKLVLYSPSEFRREIICRSCLDLIQEGLEEIFNAKPKVIVIGDNERKHQEFKEKNLTMLDFNPQLSFDTFVVGASNRLAYGAAVAITKNPGQTYNPLFFYGPPGVGKTHLLYAIANELRKKSPDMRAVYLRGDELTNKLIEAIREGRTLEFHNDYRSADLFLVDDVQFIAGKESTQEEFFHTFNRLYEAGRQIVITSDRRPSEMPTLEDRLRSRFEWGLLIGIEQPDYDTRLKIIHSLANKFSLELGDDVCNYIATNITGSVRQIEGALKKLFAYKNLGDMPLNLSNVSMFIKDLFKGNEGSVPSVGRIINQVCKYYSIEESTLKSAHKHRGVAEARQVAIYLIRKFTNLSLPEIGKEFKRDHSTIVYAIRKIETALNNKNEPLQRTINEISMNIQKIREQ